MFLFMGIVVSSFSNAQRTPRVYGEYIQPYDMGMLQYGLEYKQNKYNRNLAIINQYVNDFLFALKRQQGRGVTESHSNWIRQQMNAIEAYYSYDLSNDDLTNKIINSLRGMTREVYSW